MSPFKKLFGLFLASLLDIGTGIITTRIIWFLFGLQIEWYHYIIGIFFAMLPDIDILSPVFYELTKGKEFDSSHKSLPTHYPLVIITISNVLILLIALCLSINPGPYVLLVTICLILHHFHDSWQSQENGPGVRWLAPFRKNYYQFLSRHKKGEKFHLFLRVSHNRVEHTFKETLEEWLNGIFFKFTWENAIGITIFLVSLIAAITSLI